MRKVELTSKDLLSKPFDGTYFDFATARMIYSFFSKIGVLNNMTVYYDHDTGNMWLHKAVYQGEHETIETHIDKDGNKTTKTIKTPWFSSKYVSLHDFLESLVRVDRSRFNKVKNAEQRINEMHNAVTKLKGMISE